MTPAEREARQQEAAVLVTIIGAIVAVKTIRSRRRNKMIDAECAAFMQQLNELEEQRKNQK